MKNRTARSMPPNAGSLPMPNAIPRATTRCWGMIFTRTSPFAGRYCSTISTFSSPASPRQSSWLKSMTAISGMLPVWRPPLVSTRMRYARELFDAVEWKSTTGSPKIRPRDVTRYVADSARRLKAASASVLAVSVRDFLRFLAARKGVDPKFSTLVFHPAPWPLATLPVVLSKTEVRPLFSAFDRHTEAGRRDFAIVMLMADLGLRCQEVRNGPRN